MRYQGILETIGRTPVTRLNRLAPAQVNLYVKLEAFNPMGSVKDRLALGGTRHVDGAFGLWAKASPRLAPLAHGVELADSWATDAHKWLNVPYDSGLAFVREPGSLPAAMAITAEYLPVHDAERSPSDFTPELSRRARGVEVWAALRSLGRSGLAEMFERNCRQARRFAASLAEAGYESHIGEKG